MAFLPRDNAIVALLAVAFALSVPRMVFAQSASAQAEAMFRDGRARLNAGQIAEACTAFEASQKLAPAISTLMNLAACREKNGQLATAWGLFLDAEQQTRDAPKEAIKKLHQVALNHAKKLEPRVSKLIINIPADNHVEQLDILRGAEAIDPAMWNRALPIDGGRYKITARAPRSITWTTEITIGVERDAKTVEIPKLQRASAPVTTDEEVVATKDVVATSQRSVLRSPLVIGAGGALLMISAAGVGLWGNSTYDAARTELMDPARRDSLYSSANTKRHIAWWLGATSVACGGVSAWLYLTERSTERSALKTTTARAHVVPMVGESGAGLAVLGSF